MPRGGKRTGAGRKKGGHNRLTEEAIRKARAGLDPLDYLMGLARNEDEDKRTRMDAAKACLPYTHHKLIASDNRLSGELAVTKLFISNE